MRSMGYPEKIKRILESLCRDTFNAVRITPILISLHWFKVNERIKYKVLSLT